MNINKKRIAVFTIILIFFYCFCCILPSYAINFDDADIFITKGKEKKKIDDLTEIGEKFSGIGKVLIYIGAGILVGGLGYIGIMYMISSPEKRAKLKQQLIGVLVAGVVIFGAYSIWSVLITILAGTIGD